VKCLVEVEEKLSCVFGLCDDCGIRRIVRQSCVEQRAVSHVQEKPLQSQDAFQQQLQGMTQSMLTSLTRSLQAMNELQTLAHFCTPCILLRQMQDAGVIELRRREPCKEETGQQ
jgi:hypothetical protein